MSADTRLVPTVFMWDSSFLCDCERFLKLYSPFRYAPDPSLHISNSSLKKLLLRRGDFIEDRLGQQQRHMLTRAGKQGKDGADVLPLFDFFGSFLLEVTVSSPSLQHHMHGTGGGARDDAYTKGAQDWEDVTRAGKTNNGRFTLVDGAGRLAVVKHLDGRRRSTPGPSSAADGRRESAG